MDNQTKTKTETKTETKTSNRKATSVMTKSKSKARSWTPGMYLVTRDPATRVGPTDLGSWFVKVADCPGGRMALMGLYKVNPSGCPGSTLVTEADRIVGRTLAGSGERYLATLSASPHLTVARYEPKALTMEDVEAFVRRNARRPYHTAFLAAESVFADHPALLAEVDRRLTARAVGKA